MNPKYQQIAQELCDVLNVKDYCWKPQEGGSDDMRGFTLYHSCPACFEHPEAACIRELWFHIEWNAPNKFGIGAFGDKGVMDSRFAYSQEPYEKLELPSIGANAERSAEAIVGEIERRLRPELVRQYPHRYKRWSEFQAAQAKAHETVDRILAALPGSTALDHPENFRTVSDFYRGDGVSNRVEVTVNHHGSQVDMKFQWCDAEIAVSLLEAFEAIRATHYAKKDEKLAQAATDGPESTSERGPYWPLNLLQVNLTNPAPDTWSGYIYECDICKIELARSGPLTIGQCKRAALAHLEEFHPELAEALDKKDEENNNVKNA